MDREAIRTAQIQRQQCLCGCGELVDRPRNGRKGIKRGHHRRIDKQVIVLGNDCYVLNRYKQPSGHCRIWDGSRVRMAHLVYYENEFGKMEKGKELHHLCGNTACVNVNHLIQVTRREHMALDGRFAFGNPYAIVSL